jgi:hypothetical protein
MTPAENERFTSFIRRAAEESRELGYAPNNFVRMLNADRGFETAKRLLIKPTVSEGFFELFNLRRLDLTVDQPKEIGREEAFYRGTYHRFFSPVFPHQSIAARNRT